MDHIDAQTNDALEHIFEEMKEVQSYKELLFLSN